ncbi:uncharacterized protein LOC110463241 [Mizuhopecten yessoensis]|uniref:Uncharacterized protein n=1 Tax=Mizuhopecten yessoensis TaxID=6573 RepID=A0A210PWM3_MIZYE|nr:uncharacterized protein LOC110463241 [Mizuhopecten yessoensis]OWF40874.1 hypothetical protein KP79_PYT20227 [Mizuhopecten yessoensis]
MVYETPRSSRSESPVAPYPGFDIDGTRLFPTPIPRVTWQGEPNAIKNRGTIGKWVFDYYAGKYDSPRPEARCPTPAAKDNLDHGRNGTVARLLRDSNTARPSTAPPRIKSEAESIASLSRGKRMKVIVQKYAQSAPSPRVPRVKPEAEDHAQVHKGGRMDKLVHSYGCVTPSPRPVPRVKSEAEGISDLSKGKRMNIIVHDYGRLQVTTRDKAVPRVKPEGEDNADLDRGKRMDRIVHSYGRDPPDREIPRVKQEGDPNYKLDMGKRMCTLMHDVKKYPTSPCHVPRVRSTEASTILRKSRGQMAHVLRQSGQRMCIHKPGVQKHMFERPNSKMM